MSIVVLKLPEVKPSNAIRPQTCPYCSGETFQRWGGKKKAVKDNRLQEVVVYRYRCNDCRRTFRHYPEGVDRASQTQRLRKLAAMAWVLGLSLLGVSLLLSAFELELSHMTVWRDLQEQAALLEKLRHWQGVRVMGVDGAYPLGWGQKQPVLIAVDLGTGQPVAIGQVNEANPQAVRRFLQPLVQRLGVSVIVTDDLFSFRQVAEKLGLEHQVCQFHVRRWVGRMLDKGYEIVGLKAGSFPAILKLAERLHMRQLLVVRFHRVSLEHFSEIAQGYPFRLHAAALAGRAWEVADVGLAG
jgi:transposase-like protein